MAMRSLVGRRQHSAKGVRYETDVRGREWAPIVPLSPEPLVNRPRRRGCVA